MRKRPFVRVHFGQHHNGRGQVGIDFKRPPATGLRFGGAALQSQRNAEVAVRLGEIGPCLEGPAVARHGVIQAPEAAQRIAQIVVRLGEMGTERERPAVARHGVIQPPEIATYGEVVVGLDKIRTQF